MVFLSQGIQQLKRNGETVGTKFLDTQFRKQQNVILEPD